MAYYPPLCEGGDPRFSGEKLRVAQKSRVFSQNFWSPFRDNEKEGGHSIHHYLIYITLHLVTYTDHMHMNPFLLSFLLIILTGSFLEPNSVKAAADDSDVTTFVTCGSAIKLLLAPPYEGSSESSHTVFGVSRRI